MKSKIGTVILIIVLIALIGGAVLLYNALGGNTNTFQGVSSESPSSSEQPVTESSQTASQPVADQSVPEESASTAESEVSREEKYVGDLVITDKDGKSVKLSELTNGKAAVVNCWASWCYYCAQEMPDFDEVYKQYGGEVVFVMINMTGSNGETTDTAKEFIASKNYSFPIYFDLSGDAATAFEATGLPTTALIDKDGYIIAGATGALSKDALIKGIEQFLK